MTKRKFFPEIQACESNADFEKRKLKIQELQEKIKLTEDELKKRCNDGDTFVDDDGSIQYRFSEDDAQQAVVKIMEILSPHDMAFVNHVLRIVRVAFDAEIAAQWLSDANQEDVESCTKD
jgi:hypothetical protein